MRAPHTSIEFRAGNQSRYLICCICIFIALFFAACGSTSSADIQSPATPPPARVNGFGSAANHVHAMLALPNRVLVLATHYGIFRSEDGGSTWQEVAAGPNQLMQGLMAYSLVNSPLNSQRLYVLTLPATIPHAGTLGLYTSADQGRTWKLAVTTASLTPSSIYLVEAGNDTPDEVYIYLPNLGAIGLRVSRDDGQHFSSAGMLPFGNILGLLAIPGMPGHLLAYGSSGVALSTDGGAHWQILKGINGGVYDMTTAGPHTPIYASGDAGILTSLDDGVTFKLVDTASFTSLAMSPTQTQVLYGKTGLTTYRSSDGGHTWKALPHISGNLAVLAVDPVDPSQVYLSLSYPTAVYYFGQKSTGWQSLTPPA